MAQRKSLAVVETPEEPRGFARKYVRVECDVEGYEHMWLEAWSNFPQRFRRDLFGADDDVLTKLYKDNAFVRAWNVTDADGVPLPLPHEDEGGGGEMPFDLAYWVLESIRNAPVIAWGKDQAKSGGP